MASAEGCILHEAFIKKQLFWALGRVHMASAESCILHEAFIKKQMFGHGAGTTWRAPKVAFCMRHSFRSSCLGIGQGVPKVAFCMTGMFADVSRRPGAVWPWAHHFRRPGLRCPWPGPYFSIFHV